MRTEFSLVLRALLFIGIAVVVWIVGVMVGQENTVTILNPYVNYGGIRSGGSPTVSIMLDYNNGQMQSYDNLQLIGNNNLWAILTNLSDDEKIRLVYNNDIDKAGLTWFGINGRNNISGGVRWQVWVNNVYQKQALDNIVLKAGDIINFKYFYYLPR